MACYMVQDVVTSDRGPVRKCHYISVRICHSIRLKLCLSRCRGVKDTVYNVM